MATDLDAVRLTKTQISLLETATRNYGICPGPRFASSAASLVRRGFFELDYRGFYFATDLGVAALAKARAAEASHE